MAKRLTKMKKPSDEQPALHMIIEKGRMVPAFQFDYERLDSYRDGTKVNVWMSIDGDRPLVRRWFATIGNYIKHTRLPWTDKETASAAIKLALALVVPFKTQSGQWSQYPRSVLDLDDTELESAILQMEQLLYDMTGLHVEALRRESSGSFGDEPFETNQPANDAGEETLAGNASSPEVDSEEGTGAGQPQSPVLPEGTGATDSQTNASEDNGDASRSNVGDATDVPNIGGVADEPSVGGAADDGGGSDTPAEPPPPAELSAEERVWLKQGAKMLLACCVPEAMSWTSQAELTEALSVANRQGFSVKDIAPKGVGNACLLLMQIINLHTRGAIKREHKLDVDLVAKTAMCSVADVTPDLVKVRQ